MVPRHHDRGPTSSTGQGATEEALSFSTASSAGHSIARISIRPRAQVVEARSSLEGCLPAYQGWSICRPRSGQLPKRLAPRSGDLEDRRLRRRVADGTAMGMGGASDCVAMAVKTAAHAVPRSRADLIPAALTRRRVLFGSGQSPHSTPGQSVRRALISHVCGSSAAPSSRPASRSRRQGPPRRAGSPIGRRPDRVVGKVGIALRGARLTWPSTLPVTNRLSPDATATLARLWRRSCSRTSASPAAARMRAHTFCTPTNGPCPRSAGNTHGLGPTAPQLGQQLQRGRRERPVAPAGLGVRQRSRRRRGRRAPTGASEPRRGAGRSGAGAGSGRPPATGRLRLGRGQRLAEPRHLAS